MGLIVVVTLLDLGLTSYNVECAPGNVPSPPTIPNPLINNLLSERSVQVLTHSYVGPFNHAQLLCLVCTTVLETNLALSDKSLVIWHARLYSKIETPRNPEIIRKRFFVFLLLLISGFLNVLRSKSVSQQFEFLAVNLEVSNGFHVTVIDCYRPPSSIPEALTLLAQVLAVLNYNEIILTGDLNWDWLNPKCDDLTQVIESPTHPNLKCPDKISLIDLFLTNAPHKC